MAFQATLMLHLTGRCNLECVHCYMDGSPRRREELPFDWVADAIRQAPALGIGTVFLTGGEPTMYSRFDDVLRLAAETEGLQTTVCTNATRIKDSDARLWSGLGATAHVSIDGPRVYHDGFRQHDGAFRGAERGIGMLVAAGVDTTVVTTVSQDNLAMFGEVMTFVLATGVRRLLVQPLLDLGRAAGLRDRRLTPRQLDLLILQLSDFANENRHAVKASIIGGNKRFFLAHPCAAYVCNGGGCHRGVSAEIKKIVVRETGTILPEATNLDPRYAIGHVAEGPLTELVARFFASGYATFDRLCRTTYHELVPDWPAAVVPWDELLATRSRQALPAAGLPAHAHVCGSTPMAEPAPA